MELPAGLAWYNSVIRKAMGIEKAGKTEGVKAAPLNGAAFSSKFNCEFYQ